MRIADILPQNRPRERLVRYGLSVLSDAEVLAIILQKGFAGENVVDMSNRLISMYGLDKLSSLSLTELQAVRGIGTAKAMQILCAFELNKRVKSKTVGVVIKSAKDVFDYFHLRLKDLKQEHFYVLLLDTKNRVIKEELIGIGTLNMAVIHPREVFRSAIKESAASIIVAHNHPSGDCAPSPEDISITKRIVESGEMLDIKVFDHVIIGKEGFCNDFV